MSTNPNKEKLLELIDQVQLVPCESGQVGWVYFIVCHETGRVKIGFTMGDPTKRARSLQTGCATELAVMAYHPGTRETERILHDRFASRRVRGEWFQISDELRAYIISAIWAMAEATLRAGGPLTEWMAVGIDYSVSRLEALPESLSDLIEAHA
jgi:hypothetical protein